MPTKRMLNDYCFLERKKQKAKHSTPFSAQLGGEGEIITDTYLRCCSVCVLWGPGVMFFSRHAHPSLCWFCFETEWAQGWEGGAKGMVMLGAPSQHCSAQVQSESIMALDNHTLSQPCGSSQWI